MTSWCSNPEAAADGGMPPNATRQRSPPISQTVSLPLGAANDGVPARIIASFPPACGRPALYEKGGVSPTHCGEIVFLFLVRSRRRRGISMTLKPAARDCFALLAMTFARGA